MKHPDSTTTPETSRRRADELIGWLREYAADRINSRLIDERRCIPPYVILDFGNRGLLGMQVPEAYGGLGLRHADHLRVLEQLGAIDLTLALVVFSHGTNGIRPIQGYATPAIREELLPLLASGRELASFALSEPGAGSHVGGIACQARPDGRGGWRLRGVKRWNASSWAGVISVFVRLVDGRTQPGGLTGFVIRQGSPGLRIGPEALTMGMRGSVQNPLYLDDVAVEPAHLLGEPGRGMEVAEAALTIGRLCIAAVCLGGLKRCAQLLARYSGRRTVASGRLLDNPLTLATQGELAARIEALEALKDQLAARLDAGAPVPPEVPMAAKVFGSDSLNWAAAQLMQGLGGRGYMENNLAPQILRDARLYSVGEGPNEPLTIQVGRKARLTRVIDGYLRHHPAGAELADLLAMSAREITDRCLKRGGPFADRSAAQLWADTLIGRVTIDTMLLAAGREARLERPSKHLERAVAWIEIRQARRLQLAREGCPEEHLIPTPADVIANVAHHVDAVGDIEQALAGEDDALDSFLSLAPGARAYPEEVDLPGEAVVAVDGPPNEPQPRAGRVGPPPAEPGCDRPVPNLRHRLEAVPAGDSEAAAVAGRTPALLDLLPP